MFVDFINFFLIFDAAVTGLVPQHSRLETELEGVGKLGVVRGRQQQKSPYSPDHEREEREERQTENGSVWYLAV